MPNLELLVQFSSVLLCLAAFYCVLPNFTCLYPKRDNQKFSDLNQANGFVNDVVFWLLLRVAKMKRYSVAHSALA